MIEIKDLLEKFSHILLKEEGKKDFVRRAISETIKVKIDSGDIKIKNNIIYLNIKPIYKNEILIKQEQIFLKMKEFIGEKTPENIR